MRGAATRDRERWYGRGIKKPTKKKNKRPETLKANDDDQVYKYEDQF